MPSLIRVGGRGESIKSLEHPAVEFSASVNGTNRFSAPVKGTNSDPFRFSIRWGTRTRHGSSPAPRENSRQPGRHLGSWGLTAPGETALMRCGDVEVYVLGGSHCRPCNMTTEIQGASSKTEWPAGSLCRIESKDRLSTTGLCDAPGLSSSSFGFGGIDALWQSWQGRGDRHASRREAENLNFHIPLLRSAAIFPGKCRSPC